MVIFFIFILRIGLGKNVVNKIFKIVMIFIPKIIHQLWIGPRACPAMQMNTWREKHPEFLYIFWNENEIAKRNFKFECQDKIDEIEEWCGKADIIRYEILYKYGGVFIDADSICLEPIDNLMEDIFAFAGYENEYAQKGLIANGTMGFVPNHPLCRAAIDWIKANDVTRAKTGKMPWQLTGPTLLTNLINKGIYDIKVYPSHYFYPVHHTGRVYYGHDRVYSHQEWGSTFHKYDDRISLPDHLLEPKFWVSILVCSYNTRGEYLRECLDSIRVQVGHFGMELIWVDDGSGEEYREVLGRELDNFMRNVRFVRLFCHRSLENRNVGYSLNLGVKLCSNELIMRMDSDDIMVVDRVEKQIDFMRNNSDCVMCGGGIRFFGEMSQDILHRYEITLDDYRESRSLWIMNHPTLCFRRGAILEVGNYNVYNEGNFEDLELELRVLRRYGKLYNLQDILLNYRIHKGQVTNGGKFNTVYWQDKKYEMIDSIINS